MGPLSPHLILAVRLQRLKGIVGHGENVRRHRVLVDAAAVNLLVFHAIEIGNGLVRAV